MVAVVFPAILSDMLHCVYEVLETSRKAKLNVSYMLLRKPIQENLYVLEAVIADRAGFARKLTEDPIQLWSQGAGEREAHTINIATVLKVIGDDGRFDAGYLAQLRYDKSTEDGFDGICNKAIHLFTSHPAIATEKLNINFIFSDWESKETQWAYIYSRLPYLLAYAYQIVEYVCAGISPTAPEYLDEVQRRIAAHAILWGQTLVR
jgi:quinol monooxygenase YgiN